MHAAPALVAPVTDVETGEPISLPRTWLHPEGCGKAELGEHNPRRLLWKHRSEGVVRLWADQEITLGLVVGDARRLSNRV